MKNYPSPSFVTPGQSRVMRAFGEEVIIHLAGEQTGGRLTLWTEITPPGGGPPPHYHSDEEECFTVVEGRVSFLMDGKWEEAQPGTVVYVPRTVVHAFKNVGDKPSRMLVNTSPSGFEIFFARCEEEFGKIGGPNMDRILAISAEHGIHFVNP